jgi:uncharacterized protein YkwD
MARATAHRARPQVEQLEDRQLLAGHITLNAALGVVNVQDSPQRDRVVVSYARGGDVRVNLTGGARGQGTFARAAVREVVVHGKHEQVVNRTDVPVVKAGGPSRDARPKLPPKASGSQRGADGLTAAEEYVFQQTNAWRVRSGLPPLVINPLLQRMAENLASAEAAADRYGDSGDGHHWQGHDCIWRADQVGYNWNVIGENAAYNYGYSNAVQQLMTQWWNSPDHRANMLYPGYAETGIGVAVSRTGKTYGIVDFGKSA